MFRPILLPGVVFAVLSLAACGRTPPAPAEGEPPSAEAGGYLTPPTVQSVTPQGGAVRLAGTAPAGARIRLATPGGEERLANANIEGRWFVAVQPGTAPQIYGLSMTTNGRKVQAEGYVLVTPSGQAFVLRSGAGARRVDAAAASPIDALDFDREGGAILSGQVPGGATVAIRMDGRQAANGRADAQGRYSLELPRARPGMRRIEIFGDGFTKAVNVDVTAPADLADGPVRSQFTPGQMRIDWLTPGGGVQSTVIFD